MVDLLALSNRIQAEITAEAETVAEDAVKVAQDFAPDVTGALRDSIHKEPDGEGGFRVIADAPEAVYVEYGTAHMAPEPFMRPAAAYAAAVMPIRCKAGLERALRG